MRRNFKLDAAATSKSSMTLTGRTGSFNLPATIKHLIGGGNSAKAASKNQDKEWRLVIKEAIEAELDALSENVIMRGSYSQSSNA